MAQEKNFENRVKSWLEVQGIYPAGTPDDKQTAPPCGWFLKMWGGGQYQKSGIPDLLICVNGFFIGCELKATTGTPSELQKKNIRMINSANGIGLVLYPEGFDQFKKIVKGVKQCDTAIQELTALKGACSSTKCAILTE